MANVIDSQILMDTTFGFSGRVENCTSGFCVASLEVRTRVVMTQSIRAGFLKGFCPRFLSPLSEDAMVRFSQMSVNGLVAQVIIGAAVAKVLDMFFSQWRKRAEELRPGK